MTGLRSTPCADPCAGPRPRRVRHSRKPQPSGVVHSLARGSLMEPRTPLPSKSRARAQGRPRDGRLRAQARGSCSLEEYAVPIACRSQFGPQSEPDFRNGAPQTFEAWQERPRTSQARGDYDWPTSTMRTCAAPPELPSLPGARRSAPSGCPGDQRALPARGEIFHTSTNGAPSRAQQARVRRLPGCCRRANRRSGPADKVAPNRYSRYRIRAHPRHAEED